MIRGLMISLLAVVFLLQACDDKQEAGSSQTATAQPDPASSTETLDGLGEHGQLPTTADSLEEDSDPSQEERLTPPFLTISGHSLPTREDTNINAGNRMWAYYKLTEAPPEGAFLVLVPEDLTATDAPANLAAALELHYLGDEHFVEETGMYLGQPAFKMVNVGDFVFRIFMGQTAEDEVFLQSEGFTIVRKDKSATQPDPAP